MPDAATLAAARPSCPVIPKKGPPCDTPLHYDDSAAAWVCPEHGKILSAAVLLQRRGYVFDAAPPTDPSAKITNVDG